MPNEHGHQKKTVTVTTSELTSDIIQVSQSVLGSIYVPSAFTGTEITFLGAESRDGTYGQVRSSDGTTSSLTVSTSCWHAVPSPVMTHHCVKLVATSTQAAARTLIFSSKD